VQRAVAAGADLDATRKAVNLDAHRDGFGTGTPEQRRRAFDRLFRDPAIEAAYRELKPDSTAAQ
jgi:hypothetical protein